MNMCCCVQLVNLIGLEVTLNMSSSITQMSDDRLRERRNELLRELEQVEVELGQRLEKASATPTTTPPKSSLSNDDIRRYSRQLLLPEFGVEAQLKLGKGSVLVVGCGGLGCPASQYLASCGLGHLGLVDFDEVEVSNLHRQVLHSEAKVGVNKAASIKSAVKEINSKLQVTCFETSLSSTNALDIIKDFDVILDATDNVATRYLLNDACVLAGKPLVSGSALRFEGQLTVYNYQNGPTYRCMFPTPPPPETVTNCSDGGVLGVVPGVIGVLEALEAIKVVTDVGQVLSGRMLLFDGLLGTFRVIKLRPRQEITVEKLIDYVQFCGAGAHDKDEPLRLLEKHDRISAAELKERMSADKKRDFLLIDVRTKPEMDICALPGSVNLPIGDLDKEEKRRSMIENGNQKEVIFVCRRGNDSQRAVKKLRAISGQQLVIKDLAGGLHAWAKHVDNDFPVY